MKLGVFPDPRRPRRSDIPSRSPRRKPFGRGSVGEFAVSMGAAPERTFGDCSPVKNTWAETLVTAPPAFPYARVFSHPRAEAKIFRSVPSPPGN